MVYQMNYRSVILPLLSFLVIAFFACGGKGKPQLDGDWVGDHAMFPAIFRVHGDSIGVTLDGKFWRTRVTRTDADGATTLTLDSPAVAYRFTFITADSGVVVVGPSRIAVARRK